MIVVYTNSRERAMLLATRLDGVVLTNNIKVRPQNYAEYHDKLESELITDGYITAFFCGQQYLFVYSDGAISEPYKMVDYDEEYTNLDKRPLPFIPQELQRKIVEPNFEARQVLYQQIVNDAAGIINAAEDNLRGELAFAQFCDIFVTDGSIHISRVRPRSMVESCVFESFNSPGDGATCNAYLSASVSWERFSWLIGCNITNAMYQHTISHAMFPSGYIEGMILSCLRYESKADEAPKIKIELSNGEYGTVVQYNHSSTFPAQQAMQVLQSLSEHHIERTNHTETFEKIPLYNIFSLQVEAEKRYGLKPEYVVNLAYELYNKSYITWPTESSAMPWCMKVEFTAASVAINNNPSFANQFKPRELDKFSDWDAYNNPYNHMGILVTSKTIGPDMTVDEKKIYDLICESNIAAIMEKRLRVHNMYELTADGHCFSIMAQTSKLVAASDEPVNADMTEMSPLQMASATVQESAGGCSKYDLLTDLYELASNAFLPDPLIFANAIDNLIAWGQVTVGPDDNVLKLTKRSTKGLRYLLASQLCDTSGLVNWVNRLSLVAQGTADVDSFESDTDAFVRDLCVEVQQAAEELKECGGICLQECVCPKCQSYGDLGPEGGWHCMSCDFTIPAIVFNHPMEKIDIAYLLTYKRTRLIDGFVSARGKEYAARIVYADGKLARSFVSPFPCPKCRGELNEYAWGLKCKNASCAFTLNTNVCGHKLTDHEEAQLLSMKTTKPFHLTNSKGKEFVAALSLGEDYKLKFIFPKKEK